jgi:DNA-binding IclR family transcriptional regulator
MTPLRAEANLTAERVLRILEIAVLQPATAASIAAAVGVHPRTARRILRALADEQYLEAARTGNRRATTYGPTVRLLAMAGQVAARLPLIGSGSRAVVDLHRTTGLSSYIAVPSYEHVVVVAGAGPDAPPLWRLLVAGDDAAGQVLLAFREGWRRAHRAADDPRLEATRAGAIRSRGYAEVVPVDDKPASLAVPIPSASPPVAALALRGPKHAFAGNELMLASCAHTAAAAC